MDHRSRLITARDMIAKFRQFVRLLLNLVTNAEFRTYASHARTFARSCRWATRAKGNLPEENPDPAKAPDALRSYFEARRQGRGIQKWTHYFDAYERHLQRFVGRDVALAEIGIFSGGSLEMWRAYFGKGLSLYGIDIAPETKVYEDAQTKIFIGDQGDPAFWKTFNAEVKGLDILIDDGSHLPEHQISTFEEIFPRLNPGGVFVCEDVHCEFNPFTIYVAGLQDRLHAYSPNPMEGDYKYGVESVSVNVQSMIESIHVYPYLVVIEKRKAALPKLQAPRHGSEWQAYYK